MDLSRYKVPLEKLRWRMDPKIMDFETTDDLKGLEDIIGQERGLASLRFGLGMNRKGYNIMVTGEARTGKTATVKRILQEFSKAAQGVSDDLCYVNNFKTHDEPVLIRLKAGQGMSFKKDVNQLLENLRSEVPGLFESQEYIGRKKEISEAYEKKTRNFFVELEKKVKEAGFALVNLQVGQQQRPELMPIIDGEPMPILKLEELTEKGRFPKEEYKTIKEKYDSLKNEIDQIFLEIRRLQREVHEKGKKADWLMFDKMAAEQIEPLIKKYPQEKVGKFLRDMIENMSENLDIFFAQQQAVPGMPVFAPSDPFRPYRVNLLVDNSEQKGPPIIIEPYPSYRNLFGGIERVVDRMGMWRTDFSMIQAGSFVKANGGFLVINLMDAIVEPGVWPALKRALKSSKMEIQTFDPYYFFTSTGLKPEPIDIDVKVIVTTEPYLYHLLQIYDTDLSKIFKVRAEFNQSMNKEDKAFMEFAGFVRTKVDEEKFRKFNRSAVIELIEEAVRMTGRQEKISTSFPRITDLLREADYWAGIAGRDTVQAEDVEKALETRIYRSNMIEEHIQELINRGSIMIDLDGQKVGQVNGLAIYNLGDYMFGKPARITASTSMGRAGIINIEREAEMSGRIHNKGMLVLEGYLRTKYAQNKPLSMSASIAFEQSYTGVDGDSASSTEVYAILSSLAAIPIRQDIAVTGSVNQKGETQPIGAVNDKIQGFYHCCKVQGLTKKQGVMIPESNLKDLMLSKEVLKAVEKEEFHIYAVKNIDQGISILTGLEAGEKSEDGTYPPESVNGLVDARLLSLVKGLKSFDESEEESQEKTKSPAKKKKK